MFDRPFFKEFVLEISGDVGSRNRTPPQRGSTWARRSASSCRLRRRSEQATDSHAGLLVAVTEKRTREEIDDLVPLALGAAERNYTAPIRHISRTHPCEIGWPHNL